MKFLDRISPVGKNGGDRGTAPLRAITASVPLGRPCGVRGKWPQLAAWSLAIVLVFNRHGEAETSSNKHPRIASCTLPATFGRGRKHTVRLWIRGDDARMLGSGVVTVSRADRSLTASIDCAGPVVLMHLPAGRYSATIDAAAGPSRDVAFSVTQSSPPHTIDIRLRSGTPLLTAK
jgi:hypothetical protein